MADSAQPISPVEATLAPDFSFEIVVFKVENTIFRVLRSGLIASSPLFETMFLLPRDGGDRRVEGNANDHPIVLQGYKASDFDALMRVVYPTSRDLLSGGVTLTKGQWIGVLRLSTIWEMTEIREFTIKKLSDLPTPLTPKEKVALARDHKVGPWLVEGLTSLTEDLDLSPDALEEAAGLRTAFRISMIRLRRSTPNVAFATLRLSTGDFTGIRLSDLLYGCCGEPFLRDPAMSCHSCNKGISASEVGGIYLNLDPTLYTSSWASHFKFSAQNMLCVACNEGFLAQDYDTKCRNCNATSLLYLFVSSWSDRAKLTTESMIREVFNDEISEYAEH